MFCLVYASAGTQKWSRTEVESMLAGFRENNASLDVTGLLLYNEGSFIQVLEGTQSAVIRLYARLLDDTRHENLQLLSVRPIRERTFVAWGMGLVESTDDARSHLSTSRIASAAQSFWNDASWDEILGWFRRCLLSRAG